MEKVVPAHQARQSSSDSMDPGRETSLPIPGEGTVVPTVRPIATNRTARLVGPPSKASGTENLGRETSFPIPGVGNVVPTVRPGATHRTARHVGLPSKALQARIRPCSRSPHRPISWRGASAHHEWSIDRLAPNLGREGWDKNRPGCRSVRANRPRSARSNTI